ncbi:MAG TPA: DUF3015 domain-containing protein [Gammaproteobacteria bacterium]|nr:DUF3015 domain-containing protein [Gammaproteobacteria bacterium]
MKKTTSIVLLTAAIGCSAPLAFAGEEGAGCGIGKVIMEGKSGKGANIVAAILNDILIPRTLFMSTASIMDEPVLGCDPTKTVLQDVEKKRFVASNMDNLSQEMAQGQGAHLEALASVMGIAETDQPAFFSMTQQEYGNLLPTGDAAPGEVLASLNEAMLRHPQLAKYTR